MSPIAWYQPVLTFRSIVCRLGPVTVTLLPGYPGFTDYGLITLLYQDSMGGLEVKGVDGEWIHAEPIKNSVLINAGDLLEIYTGGRLPATFHRVVIPEEEVRRNSSRYICHT